MNRVYVIIAIFILLGIGSISNYLNSKNSPTNNLIQGEDIGELDEQPHSLSIEALKKGIYPGSDIEVEQTLEKGSNYERFIVSYKSEGLKIYALLTVPIVGRESSGLSSRPKNGWPVIIFNHGYIPPKEYQTTERYLAYTDAFSRNGYIVLKPDLRGHGDSEGQAVGGYGSNAYTIDVLNAVSSIKKYKDANQSKIGMWGHSMGGHITLKNMVVSKDIKAGVIWAGVVASYPDLINSWRRRNISTPPGIRSSWRQALIEKYGSPQSNPIFWNSISTNSYLSNISGPIQLHHGTLDTLVPIAFSEKLEQQLKLAGKTVEAFYYPDDDHNLANNLDLALQRSVEFFDKYLKTP